MLGLRAPLWFDLTEAGMRQVKTYSGGMRRRLDVAISLLTGPSVLFLDESTTGLDPRGRADVWATLRDLLSDGTTILLTTQYLDEVDQLADRVAVVDSGRIVAEGTTGELKRRIGAERLELSMPDVATLHRALDTLDSPASGKRARRGQTPSRPVG